MENRNNINENNNQHMNSAGYQEQSQGYYEPHGPYYAQPPQGAPYHTHSHYHYGYPHSNRSKVVALLLCIFLGYLGVHHFYAGKIGMGLLYLFTGGLFGIGWFVDIIRIAVGSYRDCLGYPVVC